jgi:hypothetical protein
VEDNSFLENADRKSHTVAFIIIIIKWQKKSNHYKLVFIYRFESVSASNREDKMWRLNSTPSRPWHYVEESGQLYAPEDSAPVSNG